MNIDDWFPFVLPRAKGCPEVVARQHIRNALIELARESLIWRESQAPITTVEAQTSYAYAPAAGQQVHMLLDVKLDGFQVDVASADDGRAMVGEVGNHGVFAFGTFSGFELHPAQSAGQAIVTYSVVAPSLTAATVPDAFSRYMAGVANGALSTLLMDKDKSYSDPVGAVAALSRWEECKNAAQSDAQSGFARTARRTAKHWF